jgi:hypothetical protein
MKTISDTDFDKLSSLLKKHQFEDLTWQEKQWVLTLIDEDEYNSMYRLFNHVGKEFKNETEIEPDHEIKHKLDKAFTKSAKSTVLSRAYRYKMPVYQSVAVAFLFFMTGFLANIYKSKPIIVRDTVEVIKYITKPTINPVQKPTITVKNTAVPLPEKTIQEKNISTEQDSKEIVINEAVNPNIALQQEIAMLNVNHVLAEKNGSSMEGDTLLQKMLVTVY